ITGEKAVSVESEVALAIAVTIRVWLEAMIASPTLSCVVNAELEPVTVVPELEIVPVPLAAAAPLTWKAPSGVVVPTPTSEPVSVMTAVPVLVEDDALVRRMMDPEELPETMFISSLPIEIFARPVPPLRFNQELAAVGRGGLW